MDAVSPVCCPMCGGRLATEGALFDPGTRTFIANGAVARFTKSQADIFGALWRARNRGPIESIVQLASAAWADRLDGGPSNLTIISVQLAQIRARIAPTGYTISQNRGRPKEGFRIMKLEGTTA